MVSRADIAEQFSNFGIGFDDDILEKCWDICTDHSLGADELVETWIAYCVSHYDGADPTVEYLSQMERDELQGRKQTPSKPSASERKKESLKVFESGANTQTPNLIENDILQAYYTTPKAVKSESKLDSSPGEIKPPSSAKITPARNSLNFSPASFSSEALESSESYTKRENSGKVVCSFNVPDKSEWVWSEDNAAFRPSVEVKGKELTSRSVYGGAHLHTMESVLDDYVERMGNNIDHYLDSYEPWPLDVGSQVPRRYLGRVCVEGDGRINMHSVMLEGHSNATKEGRPVLVDVGLMTNPTEGNPPVPFAFFPGQVVVAEGKNERGRLICCTKAHSKATAALPPTPLISMETGPLRVVVGAGPFTQTDTLSYQPLKDLVEYVTLHKPHVLILIGPFVDALHPHVSGEQVSPIAETFSKYFERMVDGILDSLRGINVQVVLVASPRDVNTCGVYPTIPFSSWTTPKEGDGPKRPKLTMAPDPCILDIEGVVIGVTSTDILMHISRDETASNNHSIDRLSRLSRHVIEQRNFYPLYPSDSSLCLDVPLWLEMCDMPVTPHILILPSDFRCFTKVVEGCVVINPERLTKGFSAGSFAKLEVNYAKKWHSSIADQVKVQVVKI